MAIAADLNRVGKRPRSSSDAQASTPLKRRHVEDKAEKQTPAVIPSTSRKSATSLRSRRSLPISSPIAKPHGPEVYDTPESSRESRKEKGSPAKARVEKKGPEKKIVKRKLNRKADKTSTSNEKAFDPRRQSAINPLLVPGVKLSTTDSPVRNTRARRQSPLQKLDMSYVRIVPVNVEPEREASPELGDNSQHGIPFTSGQGQQEDDDVRSDVESEQEQYQDEVPESNADTAAIGNENGMPRQRVTDQDRNYIMRTYENSTKTDRQAGGRWKTGPDAQNSASQASPKNTNGPAKQSRVKPATRREQVEESEGLNSSGAEAQAEPKRKKGRNKMTEEEKRAKAEEKARIHKENAKETEEAELRDLDTYGKEFVQGVEDLVIEIGGLDVWSSMGAGARTITAMVAKKQQMNSARAQILWKKLNALGDIFSGKEEASADRVDHLISSLQAKSTWQVLTRDGQIRSEDTTIIDLYERVIPQSVYVLKEQLSGSFVSAHSVSWRELRSVVEIAMSLCEVAANWDPKPTTLETGIRKHVRQNIRPNLTIIYSVVKDAVTALEYQEKKEREHAAFTKRQAMKREEKRRVWERINQHSSTHQSSQPANLSNHTSSQQVGDEQMEAAFDTHVRKPVSDRGRKVSPPPPLRRRPTEEIPAPDPNTFWSEKENIALLNGLQQYLESDRYTKILKDPKFAKALRGKDAEQCLDRAVFFQTGCSQILKEKADAGESSFDWLRSV